MELSYHIIETFLIAVDMGFGPCAAKCLAIGDADVDLRHWHEDRAHGMTPADPATGEPTVDPSDARQDWLDWIEENTTEALRRLDEDEDDCCSSLYYLGMALHAVQDFEAHHGMTNAEHANEWLHGHSPDNDPGTKERGRVETRRFLLRFLDNLPDSARDAILTCDCDAELDVERPPLDLDPTDFLLQALHWWLEGDEPPTIRWPNGDDEESDDQPW